MPFELTTPAVQIDTPILFLVFNRLDTTAKVFDAIRQAQPRQLFVAADGPRAHKPGEYEACMSVRKLVDSGIDWPCEVHRLYRDENLGCGSAVSAAITWFFDNVEQGIILEDDILPNSSFFKFCQDMLERYDSDERIMHIAGTSFQCGIKRGKYDYYFSQYPMIWGWATWRRAWKKYSFKFYGDTDEEIASNIKKSKASSLGYSHFYNEFLQVKLGNIDTWDYQWVYSIIRNNGICINTQDCLVKNIGFNENATHTTTVPYWYKYLKYSSNDLNYYSNNSVVDIKADNFYLEITEGKRTAQTVLMKILYKLSNLLF